MFLNGSCFAVIAFVVIVLSNEPKQNQGQRLVDRKVGKAPTNFIADRSKAALVVWLFGGFRCGVWT